MTLFIAILIIAAFDMPSILYFVAFTLWVLHLIHSTPD